eukprot:10764.XXX_312498_310498_1 [CDS] Oithona nana genome sequencing.
MMCGFHMDVGRFPFSTYHCLACNIKCCVESHFMRYLIYTRKDDFTCALCSKSTDENKLKSLYLPLLTHDVDLDALDSGLSWLQEPIKTSTLRSLRRTFYCSKCDMTFVTKVLHKQHLEEHQ